MGAGADSHYIYASTTTASHRVNHLHRFDDLVWAESDRWDSRKPGGREAASGGVLTAAIGRRQRLRQAQASRQMPITGRRPTNAQGGRQARPVCSGQIFRPFHTQANHPPSVWALSRPAVTGGGKVFLDRVCAFDGFDEAFAGAHWRRRHARGWEMSTQRPIQSGLWRRVFLFLVEWLVRTMVMVACAVDASRVANCPRSPPTPDGVARCVEVSICMTSFIAGNDAEPK